MNKTINTILKHATSEVAEIALEATRQRWVAFADECFILASALYVCRFNIPGAIVELGCNAGHTSIALRKVMNLAQSKKELHVCDSFEGLPEPTDRDMGPTFDPDGFRLGSLTTTPEAVLANFAAADVEPPIIHKGWFKDIADYPDKIALAFLDGDLYESIRDGLEVIYPRLSPGGICVVHDYDYSPLPGAARAVIDFFVAKPERVVQYGDSAVIVKD